MIPLILMAAGTAIQVMGQYKANMDQAKAELANAAFYKEQADFAFRAGLRQADITQRSYEFTKGSQISAYARGGVDMSGSASSHIADTVAQMYGELAAIEDKRNLEVRTAMLRSRNSEAIAAGLSDPGNNLMQAGGTVLVNMAKGADNGKSPAFFGGATAPQSSYSGSYSGSYKPRPSGGQMGQE